MYMPPFPVASCTALIKKGIVALPIHDAMLAQKHHADAAKEVMEREAWRMTEADILASVSTAVD